MSASVGLSKTTIKNRSWQQNTFAPEGDRNDHPAPSPTQPESMASRISPNGSGRPTSAPATANISTTVSSGAPADKNTKPYSATFTLKQMLKIYTATGRIVFFRPAFFVKLKSIANIRYWKVFEPRSYSEVILRIFDRLSIQLSATKSRQGGAPPASGGPNVKKT